MVARARLLAAWFVTMLVLAAVPAVVPTASAGTSVYDATFEPSQIVLTRGSQTKVYSASSDGALIPGDLVRFFWNMTWTPTCSFNGVSGNVEWSAATVDGRILGQEANAPVTTVASSTNGRKLEYFIEVETATEPDVFSDAEGTGKFITLDYTLNCVLGSSEPKATLETQTGDQESPTFTVDTRLPTFESKPLVWTASSNPDVHADVPNQIVGRGATTTFFVWVNDSAGVKHVKLDLTPLGGTLVEFTPPGPQFTDSNRKFHVAHPFMVPETPALTSPAVVEVEYSDVANNLETDSIATVNVDNTPPTDPITGVLATVWRNATSLNVNFSGTMPAGTAHAQVRINGTAVGAIPNNGGMLNAATRLNLSDPTMGSPNGTPIAGLVPIELRPVDGAGNVGAAVTIPQVPYLSYLSYGDQGGMPSTVAGTRFGNLVYTIAKPSGAWGISVHPDTFVRLELVGKGFFRNGTSFDGSADSHFDATMANTNPDTVFRPPPGAVGSTVVMSNFTGKKFMDGTYVLHIKVNGTSAPLSNTDVGLFYVQFQVDSAAPAIVSAVGGPDTFTKTHSTDDNLVRVKVDLTETRDGARDSGIRNVTLAVVNATTGEVLTLPAPHPLTNQAKAQVEITADNCVLINPECDDRPGELFTPPDSFGGTVFSKSNFKGWINVTFPGLPVGDYKLRLVGRDMAGNEFVTTFGNELYKVRPRVQLVTDRGLPFATPTHIEAVALAAHDTLSPPTGQFCVSTISPACSVDNVKIYARNVGQTGDGVLVAAITQTRGQELAKVSNFTKHAASQMPADRWFYNYSNSSNNIRFPYPTGVDPSLPVEIRAVATLRNFDSATLWTRAASTSAPTLAIKVPSTDWAINTTGTVAYNVSFEIKGVVFQPKANMTLYNLSNPTGQPVVVKRYGDDQSGRTFNPPFQALTPVVNHDGRFHNYTGSFGQLDDGEYMLVFNVSHETTPEQVFDTRTRFFAVQKGGFNTTDGAGSTIPALQFLDGFGLRNATREPAGQDQFFVRREFEIPVKVNHGFANLSSDADFGFQLRRAVFSGNQQEIVPLGQDGFTVSIRQPVFYSPDSQNTTARLLVRLPSSAKDGEGFRFEVNATTDAKNVNGVQPTARTATGFANVVLDLVPPSGALQVPQTQQSGQQMGGELVFRGFAQDLGSGVKKVEVRVIDVEADKTIFFDVQQRFGDGSREDGWASNEPIGPVNGSNLTNVQLSPQSNGIVLWSLHTKSRGHPDAENISINNATLYRVDVRVTDGLGRVSEEVNSTLVRFDGVAPTLRRLNEFPSGIQAPAGATQVDWHGTPRDLALQVKVAENQCLKRVSLLGQSEKGTLVGPANMSHVGGSRCSGGADSTWEFRFSQHPSMSEEIGNYTYWWEAEDEAGNVAVVPASQRRFTLEVVDNSPPEVRYITLEPPVAAAGSTARIVAEVHENQGIERVEVEIRNGTDNQVVATGNLTPDPSRPPTATGTGFYLVETANLNLTLETGAYVVRVRAIDVNAHRTCPVACLWVNTMLRVVPDAPPAVIQEAPGAGVEWVNATPTFRFRVIDRSIETSGINVSIGPDAGNLTPVAPTFAPYNAANGSRLGYVVSYQPAAALPEGDNLTVRVEARSARTGFSNVSTFLFNVDATPPNATHAVNGTVTLGGKEYAVSGTRVTINATDNLTSPVVIRYTVNGGTPQTYSGPITPSGDDGEWRLRYTATDGAGNPVTGEVVLHVDKTGPVVNVAKHGDELLVTVTDDGAGVDETNVTVHYAYGTSVGFTPTKLEKQVGNGYGTTLPGNATETGLRYYFEAKDRLGNSAGKYTAAQPYVIEKDAPPANLPPTLRITAPTSGAKVDGVVELRWIAEDPEGAPLTITIALRDPAPGRVLVPGGENSGRYSLNVSGYEGGTYTLVVTASDGAQSELATVSFSIERRPPVEALETPPPTVEPDTPVSFRVALNPGNKTISTATYRILRDGVLHTTGTLLQGSGVWGAQVTPTEPGDYEVFVSVAYADGTSEAPKSIGKFQVQGDAEPPSGGFPASLGVLLGVGVIAIAAAAYGAFGRWKQ